MLRTSRNLLSLQRSLRPVTTAIGLLLGLPEAAMAQMIPEFDFRTTFAHVRYLGMEQQQEEHPSSPFGGFVSTISLEQPNPDPNGGGSCNAFTSQISQFEPSYISMFGTTSASWNVHQGSYDIVSATTFRFRLNSCAEIDLDAWLDGGDILSPMWLRIIEPPYHNSYFVNLEPNSSVQYTGRLGPGTYQIEGASYLWFIDQESAQGATYSLSLTCVTCSYSLIRDHPDSTTVGCGGTASFSVTPSGPGLTYQWRRNRVPISNGGRISGATSSALVISNACVPDTGYYDVVLSDGTVLEPSGLARLQVVETPTGIEAESEVPRDFSIVISGPNPFTGRTSFRYATDKPKHARVAIYNAAGALVRMLADGVLSGSGVLEWNGVTTGGVQAPTGVYFLLAETESGKETRNVVLLR